HEDRESLVAVGNQPVGSVEVSLADRDAARNGGRARARPQQTPALDVPAPRPRAAHFGEDFPVRGERCWRIPGGAILEFADRLPRWWGGRACPPGRPPPPPPRAWSRGQTPASGIRPTPAGRVRSSLPRPRSATGSAGTPACRRAWGHTSCRD